MINNIHNIKEYLDVKIALYIKKLFYIILYVMQI
jgi:hypothetical protein